MRGNSIFDPDQTGIGQQPYFLDQWATLYQSYTVMGSSIAVHPFSNTGAAPAFDVVIIPSTLSTAFGSSSLNVALEQPYKKSWVYQTNQPSRKMKSYMSTAKIIGIRKSQVYDDPNLSALISANPSSQWYWHIYANTTDQSSNQLLIVRVMVTYYVRFFNRARPAQS